MNVSNPRILLAEDDENLGMLLKEYLKANLSIRNGSRTVKRLLNHLKEVLMIFVFLIL